MSKKPQSFAKKLLGPLKWIFAVALLTVLIRSGKLSIEDLRIFLSQPLGALSCLLVLASMMMVAFLRWRVLLDGVGITVPYSTTFSLGMLGQFFSSVIPGTVGGDLVKAVYITRRFPGKKMKVVSTIFLDRLMGLAGMIVLGAIGFLLGRPALNSIPSEYSPIISVLGNTIVLAALSLLGGMAAYSLFAKKLPGRMPAWVDRLPAAGLWHSIYDAGLAYRTRPGSLWKALGLSLLMHTCNIGTLFIVAKIIFGAGPWGNLTVPVFAVACVLGLIVMAVPIAPMGLGVGQLAFGTIFAAVGAPSASFGAALVTAFQLVGLTLNLCGAFFFATYRHEIHEAEEAPA